MHHDCYGSLSKKKKKRCRGVLYVTVRGAGDLSIWKTFCFVSQMAVEKTRAQGRTSSREEKIKILLLSLQWFSVLWGFFLLKERRGKKINLCPVGIKSLQGLMGHWTNLRYKVDSFQAFLLNPFLCQVKQDVIKLSHLHPPCCCPQELFSC